MLEIFNVIMLAGTMAANVTFYPFADTKITDQMETAYPVDFHREWWREDGKGKCVYKGIMVPFERNWDDVREHAESGTQSVNPAAPGKMAGQALLINQKVCGEKVETVLRGGDRFRLVEGMTFYKGVSVAFTDLTTTPKELQGRWMLQILDRLERVAPTNAAAADFLNASPVEIANLRALLQGEALAQSDPQAAAAEAVVEGPKVPDAEEAAQESSRLGSMRGAD